MESENTTVVLSIPIPSTDPVFLAIVGVHIVFGLASVIAGAAAMLSNKGRGRHSNFGTIYFWCLFRGVHHHECSVIHALGGKLPLVYSGSAFFRLCIFRTHRCPAALAPMAQAAPHRHGRVLHRDAHGVLRGQRQELAALERAAANCVLVLTRGDRNTANPSGSFLAPAGSGVRSLGNKYRQASKFGLRQNRLLVHWPFVTISAK